MSATKWAFTICRAIALYEFKYKVEKYVSAKNPAFSLWNMLGIPKKLFDKNVWANYDMQVKKTLFLVIIDFYEWVGNGRWIIKSDIK